MICSEEFILHPQSHIGGDCSILDRPDEALDDAPEKSAYEDAAVDWVTNATNTLGLHFTVCMNFEPYEPGGWAGKRDVVPPVFPVPED